MASPAYHRKSPREIQWGSQSALAFAGTDYLGMSAEGSVLDALRTGLELYGASPAASRWTSGTCEVHEHLEEALAEFLGMESALVLGSGGQANLALLETWRDDVQRCLLDADAHSTLVQASRLHGGPRHEYGAGDPTRLLALCDRFRDQPLAVLSDGVFPTTGRIAPVSHILRYLPENAWLLLDDSHGIGVVHPSGRGTLHAFGTQSQRTVLSFSMAKALGAFGGALVGPAEVIQAVRRRSELFGGSSALPPAYAAAALAALRLLESQPQRVQRLHKNIKALHRIAERFGKPRHGTFLPVWNLAFEEEAQGQAAYARLLREGIFAPLTRYGSGQDGAYLRIAVNSEHTEDDLARLAAGVAAALENSGS